LTSKEPVQKMPAQLLRRHFASELQRCGYRADPAQQYVLERLADWLQAQLTAQSYWSRSPKTGVYLWGGVGRGKSFVMDCLFEAAPLQAKRRVHVHAFLQEVQARLLTYSGQAAPLRRVAADLAAEARLLCFDEFHVHDIGDAILLGRLLECLLRERVALVFTSNYAPNDLCPNPLYHQRFLPFIRLLQRHMQVLELGAGQDYRQQAQRPWGHYILAGAVDVEPLLRQRLQLDAVAPAALMINRRRIALRGLGASALWVDFAALFQQPTAVADYLWLCSHFSQVAISGIQPLSYCTPDVQQRFINFIDIAYDAGVELLLGGELSLTSICAEGLPLDFARTHSRLLQLRALNMVGRVVPLSKPDKEIVAC
jgi:cell division protein ZapE